MSVMITGASGFIGHALVEEVSSRGAHVKTISRNPSKSNDDNIHSIKMDLNNIFSSNHARASLRESYNVDSVRETLLSELKGVDVVVHAAGQAHIMDDRNIDSLDLYMRGNHDMTFELASLAREANVRRFIFLSSIKVNGEETGLETPFTADDIVAPKDGYGVSKLEAEKSLLELARYSDLEVTIIRPPLVYGPGVKGNFRSMMYWVKKGLPLPLGLINNRRSLIGLDNLVDLIITCMYHPNAANEIFLASDDEDVSTPNLIRRLALSMERESWLIPIPAQMLMEAGRLVGKRDAVQRLISSLHVDISKTKNVLEWRPPYSLDEGLKRASVEIS